MKGFFAILVCIFTVTITAQVYAIQEFAKALNIPVKDVRECLTENHLTEVSLANLEKIFQGVKLSDEDKDESLEEFGCFIVCVLVKSKIIKNNQIQLDSLVQLAERNNLPINDEIKQKLNGCIDDAKQQEDKCKKGLTFSSCLIKELSNQ